MAGADYTRGTWYHRAIIHPIRPTYTTLPCSCEGTKRAIAKPSSLKFLNHLMDIILLKFELYTSSAYLVLHLRTTNSVIVKIARFLSPILREEGITQCYNRSRYPGPVLHRLSKPCTVIWSETKFPNSSLSITWKEKRLDQEGINNSLTRIRQ